MMLFRHMAARHPQRALRVTPALSRVPALCHPFQRSMCRGCRALLLSNRTRLSDVMVSLQSSTAPGARWGHEHLRGEYVEVRAIAVDLPRAILVLSVGRAGLGRPRSTRG